MVKSVDLLCQKEQVLQHTTACVTSEMRAKNLIQTKTKSVQTAASQEESVNTRQTRLLSDLNLHPAETWLYF